MVDEQTLKYWHPQRHGVKLAPETFRQRLKDIHPDLEVTWHPLSERWLVWYKRDRVKNRLCPGWLLLFPVETSWGEYVPLDERVFAAIYEVSNRKMGEANKYWERLEAEQRFEKASRDRALDQHARDRAGEDYDYHQIKNIGSGSKFQRYHS